MADPYEMVCPECGASLRDIYQVETKNRVNAAICDGYYVVGFDDNGELWLWDAIQESIFCDVDDSPRETRGYDCPTFCCALSMLRNKEVP